MTITAHDESEQIPAFVGGSLPDVEATAVERHIRTCDACAAEVRSWSRIADAMRASVPAALPAKAVVDRAILRLDSAGPGAPGEQQHSRFAVRFLAVACAVLLVGGVAAAFLVKSGGVGSGTRLTAAYGDVVAARTARLSFRSETRNGPEDFQPELSGEGVFDFERRIARHVMRTRVRPDEPEQVRTTLVAPGAVYLEIPEAERVHFGGKQWVKTALPEGVDGFAAYGASPVGGASITSALQDLENLTDVEEVGTEDVRGTPTTIFRGTVPFERLIERLPPEHRAAAREQLKKAPSVGIDVRVWIADDGLPLRVEQVTAGTSSSNEVASKMEFVFTVDVLEYGIPADLAVPAADEVLDTALPEVVLKSETVYEDGERCRREYTSHGITKTDCPNSSSSRGP